MRKYSLILLLIYYTIYLISQHLDSIIKEDRIKDDTVIWKGSKDYSLISISVKEELDSTNGCLPKIPKGMNVKSYESNIYNYISDYLVCKQDSLNNIFLNFISIETLKKLLQSSSNRPLILFFKIKENGEICSVTANIKKDVIEALNSEEYYKFQRSLKRKFIFKAPSKIGLTGSIMFTIPITKEQIQRKLYNSHELNIYSFLN